MIDVSDGFKNAVINGTTDNRLKIIVFGYNSDGTNLTITNENIVFESMVIEQAICDESELKFGGAVASSFEIEIVGVPDLTGKYITVKLTQTATFPTYPCAETYPSEATYPTCTAYKEAFDIFSGEVFSCELSKNHLSRKLVAYDRFYWRGGINCTEWYANQHKQSGNYYYTSIYDLRKAICENYRIIEAYGDDVLPIDDMEVEKVDGKVTVGELLGAVCEMSGVFCMLNGSGNIEYHTLSNDSEIPDTIRKPGTEEYGFNYKDCSHDEFTKSFTGILHRNENGVSSWFGTTGENSFYVLDENILADSYTGYSSWRDEMEEYIDWHGFMKYLRFEAYTPMNLVTPCRLWVQLGDRIKFQVHSYSLNSDGTVSSEDKEISSYVLSRRITGIQALTDEFTANGENVRYSEESVFEE